MCVWFQLLNVTARLSFLTWGKHYVSKTALYRTIACVLLDGPEKMDDPLTKAPVVTSARPKKRRSTVKLGAGHNRFLKALPLLRHGSREFSTTGATTEIRKLYEFLNQFYPNRLTDDMVLQDLLFALKQYDFDVTARTHRAMEVQTVKIAFQKYKVYCKELVVLYGMISGNVTQQIHAGQKVGAVSSPQHKKSAFPLCFRDFLCLVLTIKNVDIDFILRTMMTECSDDCTSADPDKFEIVYRNRILNAMELGKHSIARLRGATNFFDLEPTEMIKKLTKYREKVRRIFQYVDVNSVHGDIDSSVSKSELVDGFKMGGLCIYKYKLEDHILHVYDDEFQIENLDFERFAAMIVQIACPWEDMILLDHSFDPPTKLCAFASRGLENMAEEELKNMKRRIASVRYRLKLMYEGAEASITKSIFFYDRVAWSILTSVLYPLVGLPKVFRQFKHGGWVLGLGELLYYLLHSAQLGLAMLSGVYYTTIVGEVKNNVVNTTDPFQAWIPMMGILFFTIYRGVLAGFPDRNSALTHLDLKLRHKAEQLKQRSVVVNEFESGSRAVHSVFEFCSKCVFLSDHWNIAGECDDDYDCDAVESFRSFDARRVTRANSFSSCCIKFRSLGPILRKVVILNTLFFSIVLFSLLPSALRSFGHCGKYGSTHTCQTSGCHVTFNMPLHQVSLNETLVYCVSPSSVTTAASELLTTDAELGRTLSLKFTQAPSDDGTVQYAYFVSMFILVAASEFQSFHTLRVLENIRGSLLKLSALMDPERAMNFVANGMEAKAMDGSFTALPGFIDFRIQGNTVAWAEARYFILLSIPLVARDANIWAYSLFVFTTFTLFAFLYTALYLPDAPLSLVGQVTLLFAYMCKLFFTQLVAMLRVNLLVNTQLYKMRETSLMLAENAYCIQASEPSQGGRARAINAIKNKVGSKERATFEYQRESRKLLSETISGAARSITRLMETTDSTHAMTLLGLPVGIPLIRSLYTILILVALAAANKYFPKLMVLIPLKKVDRLWDSVNPLCDPYGGSHHWCTADYFVSV